jgi:hypothetical protein
MPGQHNDKYSEMHGQQNFKFHWLISLYYTRGKILSVLMWNFMHVH